MRLRSILISVFFVHAAIAANAVATTLISPAPPGELNLTGDAGILDRLYNQDNLQRIDDKFDKVWIRTAKGITVTPRARFAGFSFNFGLVTGTGFHSLFKPGGHDFSLSGMGYISNPLSHFRWGLNPSGAPLWSSDVNDNGDLGDHMVTFLVTAGDHAESYILAWEDLPHLGDRDYNDLVLEVGGAMPLFTPEPGTLLYFGIGVIMITLFLWVRQRSAAT